MKLLSYMHVCKELVYADLLILKQTIVDKSIDLSIWVSISTCVNAYIMPYFGVKDDFGIFQWCGILSAIGIFELYTTSVDLVSDFEGDRIINHRLTLPIPSWLALLSKAAYFFIMYSTLSIIMVPVGKICLWNAFDLTQVHYGKFMLTILFQNIFCASFSLLAASLVKDVSHLGTIWSRYIFPMWFMGGFCFSWYALYAVFPTVALFDLINPMIYSTEAMRISILGKQEGYLNFWICLCALTFFSVISLVWGMHNIKKRLDYV
jgi:hypothetical protein